MSATRYFFIQPNMFLSSRKIVIVNVSPGECWAFKNDGTKLRNTYTNINSIGETQYDLKGYVFCYV